MKKLNLRINFFWDDRDDMLECMLTIPNNATVNEVEETLIKAHKYLDTEDDTDLYGTSGRNATTLLDYICDKYGWSWEVLSFDIDLNFN